MQVTASSAVDSFFSRFVVNKPEERDQRTSAEEQGNRLFDGLSDNVPQSSRGKVINIRT